MSAAQPEPKPARRGLWLAVVVVVALLALSTWDTVRNAGENSAAALRRAAFDGDEAMVRRILAAHPEWIDSVGATNSLKPPKPAAYGLWEITLMAALGKPAPSPPPLEAHREERFLKLESLGSTALVHAVMQKHLIVARILLTAGASVRVKDEFGYPLVGYAVWQCDTNFLAALESRGAMRYAVETGYEPYLLHMAIHSKRIEMVQRIMSRGRHSLEVTNSIGGTPLWLAIASHRVDLVQLLATNGASFICVPARGETALEVARHTASAYPSSNATAVVTWLEAFAATNQPPIKPAP